MPATLWQRFTKKTLFTLDELEQIISLILRNTYEKDDVMAALKEVNTFDVGAIDTALKEHILEVFDRMEESDLLDDAARLKTWKEVLKGV
jgi:uncharacterized protein (UPF0335 family)